ncbi:MAG: lycopene cyclase family protein [Candidatus Puniceispirillaceae bacterium]
MQVEHVILGAGCAGLSLAAKLADRPRQAACAPEKIALIGPADRRPTHGWGFWQMPWLDDAAGLARKKWTKWQFINADQCITHHSTAHPYHLLDSHKWLAHCTDKLEDSPLIWLKEQAEAVDVQAIRTPAHHLRADQIYDSRPPRPAPDILWQHFLGQEVRSKEPLFDPDTAILMDFRVSQKDGLHFIYLLPFSAHEALVESTYFSHMPLSHDIYRQNIKTYLAAHFGLDDFEIRREEAGQIPMGPVASHQEGLIGLGGNGGAIRPSSGYAFAFIQKQIAQMMTHKGLSAPQAVHSRMDLWMDAVFLQVLRQRPELGPDLFIAMACQLDGDAMARFMSGEARLSDLASIILAMPKWPFIKAGLSEILSRQPSVRETQAGQTKNGRAEVQP